MIATFRIPRVRGWKIQAEIDWHQFLFGVSYFQVGLSLCFGPFELAIVRRCDCCP